MIKGMAPGIKKSCCGSSGKDGMSKGENILFKYRCFSEQIERVHDCHPPPKEEIQYYQKALDPRLQASPLAMPDKPRG